MIGDRETDMQAAHAASIGTKFLLCPEKPEHTAADFWITGLHQVMGYL
jgi:histidinol phosphatase-like enzyme